MTQEDFEDIALVQEEGSGGGEEGSGRENRSEGENGLQGKYYIYVGDIGNDWVGHCRGIDTPKMRIYIFPEPNIEEYR